MNTNLAPLKGFRDFLPQEMAARLWLKKRLVEIFTSWGYEPMETPTLESLSLFQGQIGEDEKLFFSFQDNGGRQVALRYDQTVPTARALGRFSQELTFPFRRYQIQPSFRAEKPQAGRFREFVQCDADIFGDASPYADAEMIALSLDIYRQLGFPQATVFINDRSLFADIPYSAISSIDKLDKLSPDEVIAEMVTKGITQDQARNYLAHVQNLKPNATINIILDYLKSYGFDESWFQFSPTIARAFSYSQGPIWEIKLPLYPSGTVLGGERYDGLVQKITNQSIAGTGFGLGFDRTLEAAIASDLVPHYQPQTQVLIIPMDPSALPYSQSIANQCRQLGLSTELADPTVSISKHLKYASRRALPSTIIIGQEEIDNQTITLKNLATGEQQTLPLDQLSTITD